MQKESAEEFCLFVLLLQHILDTKRYVTFFGGRPVVVKNYPGLTFQSSHSPFSNYSDDNDRYSHIQGDVGHFEHMECGGHYLDDCILDHPRHLHPWQHPGALDRACPSSNVESDQLLPCQPCCSRPWHGHVQLHTGVT